MKTILLLVLIILAAVGGIYLFSSTTGNPMPSITQNPGSSGWSINVPNPVAPQPVQVPRQTVVANSTRQVSAGDYARIDFSAVSGALLKGPDFPTYLGSDGRRTCPDNALMVIGAAGFTDTSVNFEFFSLCWHHSTTDECAITLNPTKIHIVYRSP